MDKEELKKLGIHDSWIDDLFPIMNTPEMSHTIRGILNDSKSGKVICPKGENIFRAFSTEKKWMKVVILGQDPYPNRKTACGFSFLIDEDAPEVPYSLQQIVTAFNEELEENYKDGYAFSRSLKNFGILWLNTALTVVQGKPESHLSLWKHFTEKVIDLLSKDEDIVWMIWGKHALSFVEGKVKNIVYSNHPAAVRHGYKFEPKFKEVCNLIGDDYFFSIPF